MTARRTSPSTSSKRTGARRTLKAGELGVQPLTVSPRTWAKVQQWIRNPPKPTKALRELFANEGDHDPPLGG